MHRLNGISLIFFTRFARAYFCILTVSLARFARSRSLNPIFCPSLRSHSLNLKFFIYLARPRSLNLSKWASESACERNFQKCMPWCQGLSTLSKSMILKFTKIFTISSSQENYHSSRAVLIYDLGNEISKCFTHCPLSIPLFDLGQTTSRSTQHLSY